MKYLDIIREIDRLDEEVTQGFEINWDYYDALCNERDEIKAYGEHNEYEHQINN